MPRGTCYIFGASECVHVDVSPSPCDYVIAADGGYAHALRLGVPVDLVIGDMDSLKECPDHPHVRRYPNAKEDSDMMLAVKSGMEMGFRIFMLYGGLGGRLDHTLANIQTLAYIAGRGGRGYLIGEGTVVTVMTDGEITFSASMSGKISFFAYGKAEGVTLRGFLYPLKNETLSAEKPIGLSNEFLGQESMARVEKGTLIAIWEGVGVFGGGEIPINAWKI